MHRFEFELRRNELVHFEILGNGSLVAVALGKCIAEAK